MLISQVVGPRRSEVVEIADPEPTARQVLVEVVASGVCTSDLTPWRTGPQDGPPIRLGHEIVGRVAQVGSEALRWRNGDLVTGLGDRGFAELAVMNAHEIRPVPAGVEPAHAIGEPIADLEEAIARTGLTAGMRVAVVGLGFMGLGLIQLAQKRAPGLLIGVDPRPSARARAIALGADLAFAPTEIPERFCSGVSRSEDSRMDLVLEATGVTPGLETAADLVRPFSTLCVVGYHHAGTAKMDMGLWYKGATIVNGFCPDRSRLMLAMDAALDAVATRAFDYAPLITHRFGLDAIDTAYTLMDERDPQFVKAVIQPAGSGLPS